MWVMLPKDASGRKRKEGRSKWQRIVVEPVTRIEGHLMIEVEVDGGKVQSAKSSGTLFRGIELILKGHEPGMPRSLSSGSVVFVL